MRLQIVVFICFAFAFSTALGLGDWDPEEIEEKKIESEEAVGNLLREHPDAQKFFDKSVAWVVIPTVGKGAIGVAGAARGKGLLFEDGEATAGVTLKQYTVGLQFGGQAYSEFIFFEDEEVVKDFKHGNFELGAQASAVAITAGTSIDASFVDGMAIFTIDKGGLMYEASVGGQKFKVQPLWEEGELD